MSIYNNPKQYAETTFMTLEQAKVRCNYYNKLEKLIYEAKKCPKCGEHTLEIESGCYEEGYSDYVYCGNDNIKTVDGDGEDFFDECDFTSDVRKEFEPISHWYDFDVVLAFSIDIKKDGLLVTEKNIGCSWNEFVEKENKELIA